MHKDKYNTKTFINKAILIHEDTYGYSLVNYINSKEKVEIVCKTHGIFEQTPNSHLRGRGCPKCKYSLQNKRTTHSQFLEKIDKVSPKREWKILNTYETSDTLILIEDSFGLYEIPAKALIQGSQPSLNYSLDKTKYMVDKFNITHNYAYDYSKFSYTSCFEKATIICKTHGEFEQQISTHTSGHGCPKCGITVTANKNKKEMDYFFEKSKAIHGDKYDYSKVNIEATTSKVEIICPHHGSFYQLPYDHFRGYGCARCGKKGFTRTEYIKFAKDRQGILYIIRLYNSEEEFYKIGITSVSVQKRFSGSCSMPYNYDVVYEHTCDPGCVWDLEKKYHRKYKDKRYSPLIAFGGQTECFTTDLPIKELINSLTEK